MTQPGEAQSAAKVDSPGRSQFTFDEAVFWQKRYDAGVLLYTWEARHDFGLDPVKEQEVDPYKDNHDYLELISTQTQPGMELLVVGPEEFEPAVRAVSERSRVTRLKNRDYCAFGARHNRLHGIISLGVAQDDEPEDSRAYFGRAFDTQLEELPEHLADFRGLATHLLPALATAVAIRALSRHRAATTTNSTDRLGTTNTANSQRFMDYGKLTGKIVHDVFCGQKHSRSKAT